MRAAVWLFGCLALIHGLYLYVTGHNLSAVAGVGLGATAITVALLKE